MATSLEGSARVSFGHAKEIGLRFVAEGRFESLSEACRAGLRRLEEDALVIDRLVALGTEGMASGLDDTFDIDGLVEQMQTAA